MFETCDGNYVLCCGKRADSCYPSTSLREDPGNEVGYPYQLEMMSQQRHVTRTHAAKPTFYHTVTENE